MDEIVRAAGFVVGKKAGTPAGSRVRIRLTGPLTRIIDVEVADRARVVDALAGEPTVDIGLSSTAYARLSCGRTAPSEILAGARGGVELAGDADLGRQVLEHLAFTI